MEIICLSGVCGDLIDFEVGNLLLQSVSRGHHQELAKFFRVIG